MDVSGHFTGFFGGTLMSLIAFSIVFLVCIGLMLMMMALKHFSAYVDKANAAKEAKAAAAVAAPAAAPTPPARVSAVAAEDEDEIVAVITAAIVASCGAGAKIRSIKPVAPRAAASAWRMTGILQNTEGLSESF
ncbi:OadG family protein [Synergistaceae bacterium OttesenSCG-928-I11]|nr:OadG family protein [Synergistaceae bacterium OttesenSCG-928-I11]